MKLFERFELKKEALSIKEKLEIFDILIKIDEIFLKYDEDCITNNDWCDIQKLLGLKNNMLVNPLIDYTNIYKAMVYIDDILENVYDDTLQDTELLRVQNNFKNDISILREHIKNLYNEKLQENLVLDNDIKQVIKKILPDGPLEFIPTIESLLSINFNEDDKKSNLFLQKLKDDLKIELFEDDIKILLINLINPITKDELKKIVPKFIKELDYETLAKNFGIKLTPQERFNDIVISSCKKLELLNYSIALEETLISMSNKKDFQPF